MLFALFGVSVPVFWLGLVLLYLFHFQCRWALSSPLENWPPPGTSRSIEAVLQGRFVLPWITLAFTSAAFYSRLTRSNLMETMGEDYVRTARAKGIAERRVICKHGLRSALTPVVTMLGLDFGLLLGGAIITETCSGCRASDKRGHSIGTDDFPMVMGVTVIGAVFIVVANLVVDIVYAALDPRVRYA